MLQFRKPVQVKCKVSAKPSLLELLPSRSLHSQSNLSIALQRYNNFLKLPNIFAIIFRKYEKIFSVLFQEGLGEV
jgi:hypothetical protein